MFFSHDNLQATTTTRTISHTPQQLAAITAVSVAVQSSPAVYPSTRVCVGALVVGVGYSSRIIVYESVAVLFVVGGVMLLVCKHLLVGQQIMTARTILIL